MFLIWLIFISICVIGRAEEKELRLISSMVSTQISTYSGYIDALILHFTVPSNVQRVVFKFSAQEVSHSIFSCNPRPVSIYLKWGSPPVINPDGSKIPKNYLKQEFRPHIYDVLLLSNEENYYVNITQPTSGLYYGAAFLTYVNPKYKKITQDGLGAVCLTFLKADMYVEKTETKSNNLEYFDEFSSSILPFHTPENVNNVILELDTDSSECMDPQDLSLKIYSQKSPKEKSFSGLTAVESGLGNNTFLSQLQVQPNSDYYAKLETNSTCNFTLNMKPVEWNSEPVYANESYKMFSSWEHYDSDFNRIPFNQYELIKESSSESFLYSFDFQPDADGKIAMSLNLSSGTTSVLKFTLLPESDIGGTLELIAAFKPRLVKTADGIAVVPEPKNCTVSICLNHDEIEIPTAPGVCTGNKSSLLLDANNLNVSLYVPYPEYGTWYASLRLFCDVCEPCNCSRDCKELYSNCFLKCRQSCDEMEKCSDCANECSNKFYEGECADCNNCQGSCSMRENSCNSSVFFVIMSYPCVEGKCGPNGKCIYKITEGLVFTSCVCSNFYRGWDCSDDLYANSYARIIVAFLLLVLSNVGFLITAYVAAKRNYYVESMVYAFTWFFSTFYHACDSGENIITFCIVRHDVLQFADFFCGLLSIWVTLIAMAYLANPLHSVLHMSGAILLAFGTTMNKTSLAVFIMPATIGSLIIAGNWFYQYKTKMRYLSKRYLKVMLPTGLGVITCGLLIFGLFETENNYMLLHSLWHLLTAFGSILLLPKEEYFSQMAEDD